MDTLQRICAGLDVHKDTVVACVRWLDDRDRVHTEVRTFGTTTPDLLQLLDWLRGRQVPIVAMESTGVYWKPLFNLLEGAMEVLLVNPEHIKKVPGRKTDVKDCAWIAQLLGAVQESGGKNRACAYLDRTGRNAPRPVSASQGEQPC
jgi:transposase